MRLLKSFELQMQSFFNRFAYFQVNKHIIESKISQIYLNSLKQIVHSQRAFHLYDTYVT